MIRLAVMGFVRERGRSLAAIVGIGALVAIAFTLSGVTAGFEKETQQTLGQLGGPFLIPTESTGLLTGLRDTADGPDGSSSVLYSRDTVPGIDIDLNLFGIEAAIVLDLESGRQASTASEVVVDESTGLANGDVIRLSGKEFTIVGTTKDTRMYAGAPVAFMRLDEMQVLYFAGADVARFFVGESEDVSPGLRLMSYDEAYDDISRPVKDAVASIALTRTLLWVMVAAIAFIVQRLALLSRWTEMAVLLCLGAKMRDIALSLTMSGALVGLFGGLLGVAIGGPLGRAFPLAAESSLGLMVQALVFTMVVTVAASAVGIAAIRRVVPASALRSVE